MSSPLRLNPGIVGAVLLAAFLSAPRGNTQTLAPSEPAPPDSLAQKNVLADATEYVVHHEANLPNFICMQITRRFQDLTGRGGWRPIDIIVERLTYFEHKEDYQVLEVNGRAMNLPHNQLNGASSSGEFGSVMKAIFAPDTEAQFTWQNFFKLRGRQMQVFAYQVSRAKSDYHIVVPNESIDLVAAYHGLVFIDGRNHYVHRITLHADGIPPGFPIQDVSLALDYDYTRIGDADYLLPLTFELRTRQGNTLIKNDVDYEAYRKFSSDTTIRFGAGEPPPEPAK